MFNWMVRVVPQTLTGPENALVQEQSSTSKTIPVNRGKLKSINSIRDDDQASETSQASVQSGVLNWLSNSFMSALPQPTGSLNVHRAANTEAKAHPDEDSDRSGVTGWIPGGIGKVVPQPETKYTERKEKTDEEHTEVYDIEELPDAEPLPNVPVVEMVSEDEVSEARRSSQSPTGLAQWIKTGFGNAVPYHMPRPPDHLENSSQRSSRCSDKVFSPPPESVISLTEVDPKVNMMGWIVHGLGLALPQPVIRSREDYGGVADKVTQHAVHSRPTSSDMVLEDVLSDDDHEKDQDQDQKQNQEDRSEQPSSPKQAKPEGSSDTREAASPSEATCVEHEDAETQTGRWTPFIESIKREAEDNAMANMEERLREERLKMVRMAKEVARHAAEVTIRELAGARVTVHTPILEIEEEEAELECPAEKFIQEIEESVEDPAEDVKEPTLSSPESKIFTEGQSGSPEPFKPEAFPAEESEEPEEEESETSSEPESEPEAISQQLKSCDGATQHNVTQDEGALSEEGTCGPFRCDALMACLMRVPCVPVCRNCFNHLLKENNITLPQVPPIPKLPSRLSQITQQIPLLPTRLNQLSQRITQQISQRVPKLPQNFLSFPQKLPSFYERFSWRFPQGLPKHSFSQHFSNLPQHFSNIPHHLSNLPQRLSRVSRQCYVAVQNRLISIRPQNDV